MNKWNIPGDLELEIRKRDKTCVYCGVKMKESVPKGASRKEVATWEHIINDATIITRENIARCCASCNSSKGKKRLSVWITSDFCKRKNINYKSVSEVIRNALDKGL